MLSGSSAAMTCFCPACWDSTTGVAVLEPASSCESWRRAAEEWLWASGVFDSVPMEVDSPQYIIKTSQFCNSVVTRCSALELSEELWLIVFLLVSNDCPDHSFSALIEVSAVAKRAASALRARRAEHLRLLLVNLDVERQYDIVMKEQERRDLEAFEDAWSIDSDGHWHDRFDERYYDEGSPRPFVPIPAPSQGVLQQRRLQLADGLPVFPALTDGSFGRVAPPLLSQPLTVPVLSPQRVPGSALQELTPQGRDGSPISVASTIPAVFDPTLLPHPSFQPGFVDHSFPQQRAWINEWYSR